MLYIFVSIRKKILLLDFFYILSKKIAQTLKVLEIHRYNEFLILLFKTAVLVSLFQGSVPLQVKRNRYSIAFLPVYLHNMRVKRYAEINIKYSCLRPLEAQKKVKLNECNKKNISINHRVCCILNQIRCIIKTYWIFQMDPQL